ncbi:MULTISPECIES: hypothetical protein [unclassified Winogradskyella]|uniref:hypothetical protein n=1 Tax=unclassified Winogradskyella TaxID=2615021 RepID=UPI0012FA2C85|nr:MULTISPECIES: hypothetical protein [unclassified Winogradskyella]
MNTKRIVGLLLVATGIILNRLNLENDFADFFMGIFVGAGVVLLMSGLLKSKK